MISEQTAVLLASFDIDHIRKFSDGHVSSDLTAFNRGMLAGMYLALQESDLRWIVQGWSNEAQFLAHRYMRGQ